MINFESVDYARIELVPGTAILDRPQSINESSMLFMYTFYVDNYVILSVI